MTIYTPDVHIQGHYLLHLIPVPKGSKEASLVKQEVDNKPSAAVNRIYYKITKPSPIPDPSDNQLLFVWVLYKYIHGVSTKSL